jgi:LAO/AO transport system kinase
MGDAVQSMKAGIMEAADIYVVNKSDRGGAELVEAEILAMQGLVPGLLSGGGGNWVAPIVRGGPCPAGFISTASGREI